MHQMPTLTDAVLAVKDRVAVLTLHRDDVRNALTGTTLVADIVATVDWVNRCEEVSVLVLTGQGSAFSAGGNIKEMRDREGLFAGSPAEIAAAYRQGIQRMTLAMSQLEVPAVAAVNGPAIGAGFDLACMCDIRIASDRAVIGESFINLGIIPGDGGAWYLQRLVGYQRAAELTLTGRLVAAEEALQLGLFLEVVAPERLMTRATELAALIAAKPPRAVRMTKKLLVLAGCASLAETLHVSAEIQGQLHHTDDHLEAVNAFLEKRPATYQGH